MPPVLDKATFDYFLFICFEPFRKSSLHFWTRPVQFARKIQVSVLPGSGAGYFEVRARCRGSHIYRAVPAHNPAKREGFPGRQVHAYNGLSGAEYPHGASSGEAGPPVLYRFEKRSPPSSRRFDHFAKIAVCCRNEAEIRFPGPALAHG